MESFQYSNSSDVIPQVNLGDKRSLTVPSKIAARNGGVIYLDILNKAESSGHFATAAFVCNLRNYDGPDGPFWILACPLWSFRGATRLDPGVNLLELAIQGFSPDDISGLEWARHVSYIYEMAKLRTISFVKSKPAEDHTHAKAERIFRFVEALNNIGSNDDGRNYGILKEIEDDVECYLEVTTIEPSGIRNIDHVHMSALGSAFWFGNYSLPKNAELLLEFSGELARLKA